MKKTAQGVPSTPKEDLFAKNVVYYSLAEPVAIGKYTILKHPTSNQLFMRLYDTNEGLNTWFILHSTGMTGINDRQQLRELEAAFLVIRESIAEIAAAATEAAQAWEQGSMQ